MVLFFQVSFYLILAVVLFLLFWDFLLLFGVFRLPVCWAALQSWYFLVSSCVVLCCVVLVAILSVVQ
jgi:hypothetical protein